MSRRFYEILKEMRGDPDEEDYVEPEESEESKNYVPLNRMNHTDLMNAIKSHPVLKKHVEDSSNGLSVPYDKAKMHLAITDAHFKNIRKNTGDRGSMKVKNGMLHITDKD